VTEVTALAIDFADYAHAKSGDPDENTADGRRLCTRDILHVTSIRYAVLPEWWDVEEWTCRVR
jgi:hypothetical protein